MPVTDNEKLSSLSLGASVWLPNMPMDSPVSFDTADQIQLLWMYSGLELGVSGNGEVSSRLTVDLSVSMTLSFNLSVSSTLTVTASTSGSP